VALLIVLQGLLLARDNWAVPRGELAGPDDYMRLARVVELHDNGEWYADRFTRSNVPYGQILHWTRPLDALLLAGAAPLSLVLGFRPALHWWGVAISPLFHLLTLLALMWAARPLLGSAALVYAGILSLGQVGLVFFFLPGRPDHHGLLYFLFALLLGFGVRLMGPSAEVRSAGAAGLVAALAIWTSIESLMPVGYLAAVMALFWIAARGSLARKGLWFSGALLAGLAVALVLERPPTGLGTEAHDRLSVVHLLLAALALAFWLGMTVLGGAGRGRRATLACAGAAAAIGALWLIYPKFFGGPQVDVDPRNVARWSGLMLADIRPLAWPEDPLGSLRRVLVYLGPVLPALPAAAFFALRRPAPERSGWALIALGLALFAPLAVFGPEGRRWAAYTEILLVPPYAMLLFLLLERLGIERIAAPGAGGSRPRGAAARAAVSLASVFVVVAFATGFPLLAGLVPLPAAAASGPGKGARECTSVAIAAYLEDAAAFRGQTLRILALPHLGAELLYRSPHQVVATGFHGDSSLIDVYDFYADVGDATARRIATERGIDLVFTCPFSNERVLYARADGAPTLYDRLGDGDAPPWLHEVALPPELSPYFQLFRVAGEGR
jgi:hypothetical protein